MKKFAQLLFLISCASNIYAYDQSLVTKAAVNEELITRCGTNNCRGPRGKRGPRGPRGEQGRRGPRGGCGIGEIWMNALQMTHSAFEGPFDLDFFFPFGFYPTLNSAPIAAWRLTYSAIIGSTDRIGANFNIPVDLDRTQPVTVVLHFVVPESDATGNQAKILLEAAYASSGGLVGNEAPATGFSDTITSPDFTITVPAPSAPNGSNLTQISVAIPLNPSLMVGDWAYLQFTRILPASNNFDNAIYLSTMSLQYTRTCS